MAYHLENTQLRVVRRYVRQARNIAALQQARFIILEHILPTTEEFIRLLVEAGAEIFILLAKPYSIDNDTAARLQATGIPIAKKSYKELEETDFLDQVLRDALSKSEEDGKQLVIIEVGGYFAEPLKRLSPDAAQFIAGVIEDTTFGHNRYLQAVPDVPVPVFSVARSELKKIEARFVGRDAVAAVEAVLRDLGVSIVGRNALVIGYGMIGSNVAWALRSQGLSVYVYDKHDYRNLRAYIDGFYIHKKRELIKSADIIFAATADRALAWEEIEECRNNVILASVGSKDTEFDITTLDEQALLCTPLGKHIVKYTLPNSKNVMVVKQGTAVNFLLPSLPTEVLDLVFSEILLCAMSLLKRQPPYLPGQLYEATDNSLNSISKDWLRNVNI